MRKLFEHTLSSTIKFHTPSLDIAQGGFRPQRSPLDQALCLHDLMHDYFRVHHHYPSVTKTLYNLGLNFSTYALRIYNKTYVKFISKTQRNQFADFINAYACTCCQTYFEELDSLSDHINDRHVPHEHSDIETNYKELKEEEKWTLSTGTVVEDVLYKFGKQCVVDHPACSMILDLDDLTYLDEKLFTKEEIHEMKQEKPMDIISEIPKDLKDYINHYNCNNLKDLRMRLAKTQDWELDYNITKHHDFDWTKHTIHSYIRLYESGKLNTIQKEAWYNKHVWSLIDTAFDDIESIQVIGGESVSLASSHRKNKNRIIGSKSAITRVKIGHKCDLIVREKKADHEEANEFGAGEVGTKSHGTKSIVEGGIKLPKALKDMLDKLVLSNNDDYEGIATFGLQHSGLNITLMTVDRPKKYITRINRLQHIKFPSDVSLFGKQVLPLLVLIWQFKQQIIKTKQRISSTQDNTQNNSDWLQTCLSNTITTTVTPITSTSTEYVSTKKRKVNY